MKMKKGIILIIDQNYDKMKPYGSTMQDLETTDHVYQKIVGD